MKIESYFRQINDIEDKKKILEDAIANQVTITAKGASDELFELRPILIRSTSYLLCEKVSKQVNLSVDELICTFVLGHDKYFFKSRFNVDKNEVRLLLPMDFYLLQRRQNYRLILPSHFKASYEITSINQIRTHLEGRVVDLSSGGSRLEFMGPLTMKIGDILDGELSIQGRETLPIRAEVKHTKDSESAKHSMGVQFLVENPKQNAYLFAVTLEIYRELFQ